MRSKQYLRWVRQQPCVMCGAPADDAHHAVGQHKDLAGMAIKAGDEYAMPVCREHHNRIHQDPALQYWQGFWLVQTLSRALQSSQMDPAITDVLNHTLEALEQ